MSQAYIKIFTGSSMEEMAIKNTLESINIIPVIKDEAQSARLAGFGASPDLLQVYVHKDELARAQKALTANN